MSIARTAVRVAAVKAITGRTLAGPRVADSAIEPIDVAVGEVRLPIITVTTDDDVVDPQGRDVWSGRRDLDLVIEMAVATEVKDGGFTIPQTDAGFEWTLDIMEHQIERALFDEGTPWAAVFMRLVPRVHKRVSRRGASVERGVRFAARQLVLTVDTVSTPATGEEIDPDTAYGRLLALMAEDPELAEFGELLRGLIEQPHRPGWKRAAEAVGLTRENAEAIGIAPLDPTEQGEPPILERAEIDGDLNIIETIRGRGARLTGSSSITANGGKD
jgi:hypothetical protein